MLRVPANRDHARLGRDLLSGCKERLPGREACRSQVLYRYSRRHPPLGATNLCAQVNFEPHDYVHRIAAEGLLEEGIPAFLEVGQKYRVINVPQGVRVPPPDIHLMLENRAHSFSAVSVCP